MNIIKLFISKFCFYWCLVVAIISIVIIILHALQTCTFIANQYIAATNA